VAWQSGDGALANVALDRALADEPGYSMAQLLRQVITAGTPPSLARLPMTPDEVAASYDALEASGQARDDEDDADVPSQVSCAEGDHPLRTIRDFPGPHVGARDRHGQVQRGGPEDGD
jgi:hypothetical protein